MYWKSNHHHSFLFLIFVFLLNSFVYIQILPTHVSLPLFKELMINNKNIFNYNKQSDRKKTPGTKFQKLQHLQGGTVEK